MDITTILSTVLFLGPGYLIRLFSDWIEEPACDEETTQVSITRTFIFSFIVLIINILILKYGYNKNINTFTDLLNSIFYVSFFIKYCIMTVVICFVIATLKPYLFKIFVGLYNNLINKHSDRKYSTYYDLWNLIFYNPDFDVSKHVFTIEKNGIIVTQGFLKNVTPKGRNKKKIILTFSDVVKGYFNDKVFKDRNLSEIVTEYYDLDSDVLIKAYHAEAILEDINKRITSAENV